MKKHLIIFMSLTFLINMTACTSSQNTLLEETESKLESVQMERDEFKFELDNTSLKLKEAESNVAKLESDVIELETALEEAKSSTQNDELLCVANTVMGLLKDKNYNDLANYVSPNGVRFTPYSFVDTTADILIQGTSFTDGTFDDSSVTWGSYDGSGNPITMDFNGYYDEFIYDEDYLNAPMLGNNFFIGTGNTINNVASTYSNGEYVEFHFPGFDPQYEGMDWKSLILVFEKFGNDYKLVGVVHNQWTS